MQTKRKITPNILLTITAFLLLLLTVFYLIKPVRAAQNTTQLPNIESFSTYPRVSLKGEIKVYDGVAGRYYDANGKFIQTKRLKPASTYKVDRAYIINGHFYYKISGQRYVIDNDVTYQKN